MQLHQQKGEHVNDGIDPERFGNCHAITYCMLMLRVTRPEHKRVGSHPPTHQKPFPYNSCVSFDNDCMRLSKCAGFSACCGKHRQTKLAKLCLIDIWCVLITLDAKMEVTAE